MPDLLEARVHCPYCGEPIDILVDTSVDEQRYVEDCQVCCRPIVLDVTVGSDGEANVLAQTEND